MYGDGKIHRSISAKLIQQNRRAPSVGAVREEDANLLIMRRRTKENRSLLPFLPYLPARLILTISRRRMADNSRVKIKALVLHTFVSFFNVTELRDS